MKAALCRPLLSLWHRRILGCKRWRVIKRDGIKYRVRGDFVGRQIAYGDGERAQFDFFAEQMRAAGCDVFVDVGAHLGSYSLRVAAAGLCREIYAVETSAEMCDALRKNIALNHFGEVIKPINEAVSDAKRRAVYYDDSGGDNSGGSGLEESRRGRRGGPNPVVREIETTTLDDLLAFRNRRVAIKMDVEGHELRALQGAASLLRENRVLLQVEIWPENAAHLNWLMENGFKIISRFGDDFFCANF